jgi:hypothetical protein
MSVSARSNHPAELQRLFDQFHTETRGEQIARDRVRVRADMVARGLA